MPSVRALCNLARQTIEAGSHERAIGLCRHILRHYAKSVEACCVLGEAFSERGDAEQAGKCFQLVLSADPESVDALVGLGLTYRDRGDVEQAIFEFKRALELQPGNVRLRQELLRLGKGNEGASTDRVEPTRAMLGRTYLRSGLYERAVKELSAVWAGDLLRFDAGVALAEALWRGERFPEAAQVCRDVLEIAPDCLKAKLLLADMGYNGLISGDPKLPAAAARDLDPENEMASRLFEDTASASRWKQLAVDLPAPDELELDEVLRDLDAMGASIPEPAGQEEAGLHTFDLQAASTALDEESEADRTLARVRREADERLAVARLRSILVVQPEDHVSRLSLAVALGKLDELDSAFQEFEYLVASAPAIVVQVISGLEKLAAGGIAHPKLHRLLADAHMKSGDFTAAIEHYTLALEKEV